MELEAQVEVIETTDPTGEAVSPEPTEVELPVEVPVASEEDDHSQEIADLQAAVETADTPEAKAVQQTKLNAKFAEMRRDRRDAKKSAEEARLEAARWKGRAEALAEMGQKKEEATVQPAPIPPERPKEEDFTDYGKFVEALSDWKTDQKIAQMEVKFAEKEAQRIQTETEKSRDVWLSQGKNKFKDFDAVVTKPYEDGGPAITSTMAEVINSSEVSHELAYHLGKNPNESRRIAALPPLAAARELGRLEAKLTSAQPIKPKTQTNAPAPIKPMAGEGASIGIVDIEQMSTDERIAYWNRKEFGDNWKGSR